MNKIAPNQNLLFKIFITIFITTVLTLITVGLFSFIFTRTALQDSIMDHEREVVEQTMSKIDRTLYERYIDIQAIAGERSFKKYLLDSARGGSITEEDKRNNSKRIKELAVVTGPWNTLFVVDPNGTIILSTIQDEIGKPINRWYYKDVVFQHAMKGQINYTDFVILKRTGEPAIVFAAPIRDMNAPQKPVIGAVVADFSWMAASQILDDVADDSVVLLNHDGQIIAQNTTSTKSGVSLNDSQANTLVVALNKKSSQTMVIRSREGIFSKDTLVAHTPQRGYLSYQGHGWNLILHLPARHAFADANQAAGKIVLIVLSIIIFMNIGILMMARRFLITPITTLTQTIRDISSGDLSKQAKITSNDEIGQLATTFNDMTRKLATAQENLEEKIQQRTMELSETLKELQKTHDDLKHAQVQLLQSEKLASIGQLAAGVAHEINNPVGFISNNMEILQEYIQNYAKILRIVDNLKKQIEDSDLQKAKSTIDELKKFEEEVNLDYIINDVNILLGHTSRGLERIKKIVLDLRTFAREENAEVMEAAKIEEIIDSILSIVHNELKYKAQLKKNYGNTPFVQCNPQRIGQVFINLLVNAVQAIEEKGLVEITTYQQDGYVCVDVADTGKGIPPENLKKIFDPFFTTKPVGQGTGLGLSVSYEIIKKHQGEFKVQSKVGEGTTFTIRLPIEKVIL